MRATLGNTGTGGIKWKAKDYRFEWTSSDGRISGLAESSTSSYVQYFARIECFANTKVLRADFWISRHVSNASK